MNISAGLIAKGTAGALATAAAIGGSVAAKNSGLFSPAMDLTKFDKDLIKWLETSGNDIVFTIKYKESGVGEEKEVNANDSSLNGTNSFINDKGEPVKILAEISDSSSNLRGSGNKTPLKQLNDGKKWIWSCEMTFKKDANSDHISSIILEQNKRVYGVSVSDDDGLFKKLMKDVSANSNSKKIKELKKGFIKNCAKARTKEKNKEIEASTAFEENREIKTPKERIGFVLIEGDVGKDWGEDSSLLYFKDKNEFNKWFPENVNS